MNKLKSKGLLIILITYLFTPILSSQEVEFPLVQSMAYFPYRDHSPLKAKEISLALNLSYSNIFYMYDHKGMTSNDFELLSLTLDFRYGISNELTLEFYYRIMNTLGGFMDRLIEDFHQLFGLSEGGRNLYPRNVVNYQFKDAFSYNQHKTVQSPLIIGILTNLYTRNHFRVNGRCAMGVPVHSVPGFSSNKPFLTAGLILSYKPKTFSLHFSNHLSMIGKPNWLDNENIKNFTFLSTIRVDIKKIFCGILYRSSPFKDKALHHGVYQAYLGIRITDRLEFSLMEEFPTIYTAPDVTFNLKIYLSKRLKTKAVK
jgi:hypothetical protein